MVTIDAPSSAREATARLTILDRLVVLLRRVTSVHYLSFYRNVQRLSMGLLPFGFNLLVFLSARKYFTFCLHHQ